MLGSGSSKFVVLLASVLKPVDDTRMREKFATTLGRLPGTSVHVAGRDAGNEASRPATPVAPPDADVTLHPIFQGARLSLARLAAQGHYWRLLRDLRPDIVFVHAPELLPLTLLWHGLGAGRRFVYDIRENYALNVSTQGVYRGWRRRLLAAGLRRVEAMAANRAAAVLLAEESYGDELPFLKHLPPQRVLLLENKYQPSANEARPAEPRALPAPDAPLQLLFSGTISELNGVRAALALTQELRRIRPGGARLTIVGFCQQPELLAYLQTQAAANVEWLQLIGGNELVPHAAIVAAIRRADFGLVSYRPHPSTARCRPTKLFEYLAHGLPVLVPDNPLWATLVRRHAAGLVVDFEQPARAAATLLAALPTTFYPQGAPGEVLWESEAKKLRHLLESLR